LRRSILACVGLLTFACVAVTAATHAPRAAANRNAVGAATIVRLGAEIAESQKTTWRWERVMGVALTPTAGRVLASMSVADVTAAARVWQKRAVKARRKAQHPPQLKAWLCIHRYEGSWTDTGDPYWGGLQMDVSFQRHYGAWLFRHKGTADHWTPLEQIWVAVRASRTRGFWPWPNTARFCGLM
jgi:hypothetical protein